MAGLQARAEADPSFLFKLGCECGLDLAIILTVNLACRRDKFLRELDFVLSQVKVIPQPGPRLLLDTQILRETWFGVLKEVFAK